MSSLQRWLRVRHGRSARRLFQLSSLGLSLCLCRPGPIGDRQRLLRLWLLQPIESLAAGGSGLGLCLRCLASLAAFSGIHAGTAVCGPRSTPRRIVRRCSSTLWPRRCCCRRRRWRWLRCRRRLRSRLRSRLWSRLGRRRCRCLGRGLGGRRLWRRLRLCRSLLRCGLRSWCGWGFRPG